ncbi:MAG: universal stress protein [Chloroflexi bacterium]|nr:universal stress protein [Chloroflexota bacterium]
MYNKVVVPLDGSKLAEVALPHLEEIARGCSIPEILLVSVTEPIKGSLSATLAIEHATGKEYTTPPIPVGTSHTGIVYSLDSARMADVPVTMGRMAKTALNYLVRTSRQLEKRGFKTQVSVLIGNPAEEIVHFVEEQGADLIVMASRGKSGFSRWDMGNVAEKVIRVVNVPVVLVKPLPGFRETKPQRKGTPS